MYLDFLDYVVRLSSGESLKISELDSDRSGLVYIDSIFKNPIPPLNWVPKIPRHVIEEVKIGLDINFRVRIGTPPEAALLRVPSGLCYRRKSCSSYKYEECLLRPIKVREIKEFPRCWEFNEQKEEERLLITSIIFKWREGYRVILATD